MVQRFTEFCDGVTMFGAGADDPALVGLITGYGKTRESWQQTDVKAAVTQLLVEEMGVPVDSTSAEASRKAKREKDIDARDGARSIKASKKNSP